jgi:hypothetical protein
VILEHSVLGLHTCLVPVFLPSSPLLCITCLVPALQYTPLHLLSAFIYLVCILSTSIRASLRCTCFVIARQISHSVVDIQGKPHHCPHRTLWPTDRNNSQLLYHHAFQSMSSVTDLQGPPSGRAQSDKIRDLKSLAKQYARDQGSCDDTRISYLEYIESEAEADWTLARMIAG